jgi:hypothetical protein
MSGKPKTKPSPGWGGARPGGGRKPINQLSDQQSKILYRELRKRAKAEGKTWQSILLDFVFGKNGQTGEALTVTVKEQLTAVRLLADLAVAKQSEQTVNVNKTEGPQIYLPEMKPDPAKLIAIDGKREAG